MGLCGAYLPSRPPFEQGRTDEGIFDLAVPEFAWWPVAFAEALPGVAGGGNWLGRSGAEPVHKVQAEGNHKNFG